MKFEGAKATEKGVTFGIVIVKAYVLSNAQDHAGVRVLGKRASGPIPIT